MNSRSLNSPQRILLKGFYNHDSPEEFNLPRFEEENIVLTMGKFRIIEYASKERNILIPKVKLKLFFHIIKKNNTIFTKKKNL
ncbi:27592_t:CDS:1, partial [Gigaspora margarita]